MKLMLLWLKRCGLFEKFLIIIGICLMMVICKVDGYCCCICVLVICWIVVIWLVICWVLICSNGVVGCILVVLRIFLWFIVLILMIMILWVDIVGVKYSVSLSLILMMVSMIVVSSVFSF